MAASFMELKITDSLSIKDVQQAFNRAYPFLWIDFFHRPLSPKNHTSVEKVNPETTVKKLCSFTGIKTINIDGASSVAQLEADFWETLGVKIQVLRLSRNVWVSTSYTGNWTLEKQNSEGQQVDMGF